MLLVFIITWRGQVLFTSCSLRMLCPLFLQICLPLRSSWDRRMSLGVTLRQMSRIVMHPHNLLPFPSLVLLRLRLQESWFEGERLCSLWFWLWHQGNLIWETKAYITYMHAYAFAILMPTLPCKVCHRSWTSSLGSLLQIILHGGYFPVPAIDMLQDEGMEIAELHSVTCKTWNPCLILSLKCRSSCRPATSKRQMISFDTLDTQSKLFIYRSNLI